MSKKRKNNLSKSPNKKGLQSKKSSACKMMEKSLQNECIEEPSIESVQPQPKNEGSFLMLIENHIQIRSMQPNCFRKEKESAMSSCREPNSATAIIKPQFKSIEIENLTQSTKNSDSFELGAPREAKTLFPKEWPEILKPEKKYIPVRKPEVSFLDDNNTVELIQKVK